MDLVSGHESYNKGRREAVALMLGGAAAGLAFFSNIPLTKHLPKIKPISLPEYYGEDIEITADDLRARPDESKLLERIVTIVPRSKPHIKTIVGACHAYSAIFPVPLEIAAPMYDAESGYKNNIISPVFALGGAQFMRETAAGKPFFMTVYDEDSHPELYDLETRILALRRKIMPLEKSCDRNYQKRDSRILNGPLEQLRQLESARLGLMREYKTLFAKSVNKTNDQRVDEDISYRNGIWLVSLLGKISRENFSGSYTDHLFRALSGYNAGPKNSNRNPVGIAQNNETYNHITTITNKAERIINPRGWMNIAQETLAYARNEQRREDRNYG